MAGSDLCAVGGECEIRIRAKMGRDFLRLEFVDVQFAAINVVLFSSKRSLTWSQVQTSAVGAGAIRDGVWAQRLMALSATVVPAINKCSRIQNSIRASEIRAGLGFSGRRFATTAWQHYHLVSHVSIASAGPRDRCWFSSDTDERSGERYLPNEELRRTANRTTYCGRCRGGKQSGSNEVPALVTQT